MTGVPVCLKVGSEIKKGVHEDSRVLGLTIIFKLPSAEMMKAVEKTNFEGLENKCSVLDIPNLK